MVKVFAFDLDGTLTQHKTRLEEKNRKILEKLSEKYTVLMVGAGGCTRIHEQLCGFPADVIGNYGMQYAHFENGELNTVRNSVAPVADRAAIEKKVTALREKYGFTDYAGDSVEYHASGCITIPILGTAAKLSDKLVFDPDRRKRRAIYNEVVNEFSDYNVFVGGSSSFDMAPKPYNKYYALDLWCRENGFTHGEVIFVGDDWGIGGNDESVYLSDFRFITVDDYTRLDEVLSPWLDESVADIDALLGEPLVCECGKTHSCDIKKVLIRHGAINELAAMTRSFTSILLVADENTYRVAGERVKAVLGDKVVGELIYESDGFLVPDERAVERLDAAITDTTDLVIGVGSGVINDLCKHTAHARHLPYFIVATAPSMDGYASSGAAMIFDGMKITTSATVPMAIIADTEVLCNAPIEMLKAGYGDIIGKYSCLNDWRLGALINGEHFCDYIYNLTYGTVDAVAGLGKAIISRDERAVASLMRALVLVGIAMAYMGNSRPASGSEHHLSHYFEVVGLLRDEPYFCHGTDVAYSTYVTAELRRELLSLSAPRYQKPCIDELEEEIKRVYRGKDDLVSAEGIIKMQRKLGWIFEDKLPAYTETWEEIKSVLSDSKSPDEILEMLRTVELPLSDFYAMYSDEKLRDAVSYAKYLKDRFSVLWLF